MRVTSISEEYFSGLPANEFSPELIKRSYFTGLIAEIFDRSRKTSRTGVMLTSPLRNAGVSFICSCIAAELALQGAKVLLIDARALVAIRACPPRSVIALCKRIGPLQLWVLGLEETAVLKATTKNDRSSTLGALLHELGQEFPYLLIDAPALSTGRDASLLATSVYGTVIVARSGQTGEAELKQAHKALGEFGGRLLGSIFNAH
jgi:succinoglycan biosynthesis transport protein ExoP